MEVIRHNILEIGNIIKIGNREYLIENIIFINPPNEFELILSIVKPAKIKGGIFNNLENWLKDEWGAIWK